MRILFTLFLLCQCIFLHAQNCVTNSNSLIFNGVSTYVSFTGSSSLDIVDSITVEAWIKSNAWGFSSAQNTIVCKHGWSFGEEGYVIRAGGNGELSFNIAADSAGVAVGWREIISGINVLQLNAWHHVAGTFDGDSMRIYKDGSLVGVRAFQGKIYSNNNYNFSIGRLADQGQFETRYWDGKMDEVRIWNRALSQNEIIAGMGQQIDPLTANGLVGYWRFNDGSGNFITDLGTGNSSGVLVNGTWSADVPFNSGPPTPAIIASGPYLYSNATANNQWNLNGQPIIGQTGTSIIPAQNGSYTVTVTDSLGCTATSLPYIVTTVDVEFIGSENLITSMFFDGMFLNLESSALLDQVQMKIIDLTGKTLLLVQKGSLRSQTDIGSLPNGIYLVSLSCNKGIYNGKICKNN